MFFFSQNLFKGTFAKSICAMPVGSTPFNRKLVVATEWDVKLPERPVVAKGSREKHKGKEPEGPVKEPLITNMEGWNLKRLVSSIYRIIAMRDPEFQ